jgi:hypothetical protein
MMTKKSTKRARAKMPVNAGDSYRRNAIVSKGSQRAIRMNIPTREVRTPEDITEHIQRQTLQGFLDAVSTWSLKDADSARLVGVDKVSFRLSKSGKVPNNEEVLARMTMVALIRTALDISFSTSLSTAWMTLPNSGYPYLGLSPVEYVGEHGWPGLFWVLRQCQGRAVGN